MKRLIICGDGTWQSLQSDWPTNVQRAAQFISPRDQAGIQQIVHYQSGVGTSGLFNRWRGGITGAGLNAEILRAYRFLSLNYDPGDEIFLFGYSRGAYTVRSLAGLIQKCGILHRHSLRALPHAMALYRNAKILPIDDEAIGFRAAHAVSLDGQSVITFLGCWDTVGALGVPDLIAGLPVDRLLKKRFRFHNTQLGSHILHARQAAAIDERRKFLPLTTMHYIPERQRGASLKQLWFPGTHGCVGGGVRDVRGLSDTALLWMIKEAQSAGLGFQRQLLAAYLHQNPLRRFNPKIRWRHILTRQVQDRMGPKKIEDVSAAAQIRWHTNRQGQDKYRPKPLLPLANAF